MRRSLMVAYLVLAHSIVWSPGCWWRRQPIRCNDHGDYYQSVATQIEYPDSHVDVDPDIFETLAPRTVRRPGPTEIWSVGLEDVVQMTLANSQVIRDIGGRVITAPVATPSVYGTALQETDPQFGPEAALSAFDAQFTTSLFFDRNERTLNNFFIGGGVNSLQRNLGALQGAITKRAATGTQFTMRNRTDYDRNNVPTPPNQFPSSWNTIFEAEVRQPLLQGAGIEFNRIAGPNSQPGFYNGVLLARIDTDISLAEFEAAVRDLLVEVERTYWQLYFAYRDLDAKMVARDAALETWRAVQSRKEAGVEAADGEREALAREQYYAAQADVENALSANSTSGLVVTTSGGVYTTERQLRYLMGISINDGRLIQPRDQPATVDMIFPWEDSLQQALTRRVELRKQKWTIRRRELELTAAENFLRMRLDMIGQYRWRGFGDDLLGNRDVQNGSAFSDLFSGDLQEWQLGLELSTPIGNRIGHTAVRNAEWNLTRDLALYREQEQQVVRELSTALAEIDRAYSVSRANYNRSHAAHQQWDAVTAKYEAGKVLLEFVYDAQRRATEASVTYYRSLVNYSLAIMNLHRARGTLLDYNSVYLSEGPWSAKAHASAAKQASRFRKKSINYCCTLPQPVSLGKYPQRVIGER